MKKRPPPRPAADRNTPQPNHAPRPDDSATLEPLERLLGHTFAQPALLTLALTHRSFVYDLAAAADPTLADPTRDNEQLEFLGDAALGLLAAEALCRHFPTSREGDLTRMRASVVSRKYLGTVGTRLELGRWLLLGQTAEKNDGRTNAALFANAVEALIAALYLDGGINAARRFVDDRILAPALPALRASLGQAERFSNAVGDHKSALQELLQATGRGRPEYRLLAESGPAHRRLFRVAVCIPRLSQEGVATADLVDSIAEAEAPTKKQAQHEAARLAVAALSSPRPAG